MVKAPVWQMDDPAHLSISIPDFLERRDGSRDVCPLLRFLDRLRPLLHPFLNANAFTLEDSERVLAQDAHRERILIRFRFIYACNAESGFGFPERAGIPQNALVAQNMGSLCG